MHRHVKIGGLKCSRACLKCCSECWDCVGVKSIIMRWQVVCRNMMVIIMLITCTHVLYYFKLHSFVLSYYAGYLDFSFHHLLWAQDLSSPSVSPQILLSVLKASKLSMKVRTLFLSRICPTWYMFFMLKCYVSVLIVWSLNHQWILHKLFYSLFKWYCVTAVSSLDFEI